MPRITTWVTENAKRLREQLALFERNTLDQFGDVGNRIARVIASIPTTLPPSGAAGGDLDGTYPNPSIAAGVIVDADVNPSAGIALSKLADIATARLLGRRTAASGPIEELAVTVPTRAVDLSEWHRLDPWTIIRTDFTECTTDARQYCGGFVVNAETGGTLALGTAVSDDNPGELAVTSIASSGSGVIVSAGTFYVGGDEYVVSVFLTPSSFTTHRMTIGFFQAIAATGEPTDGCYLWLSTSATLTGKCASGGVRTSTGTTVNLAVDTRYTAIVRVNAAKTSCYFAVYNAAGALVWTNTAASNLPGSIALYCGAKITSASATALARGSIDYLEARVGGPGRALGRYLGSAAEVLQ